MALGDIMAGKAVVLISAVDTTGRILDRVQSRFSSWSMRMTAIGAAATAPILSAMSTGTTFDDQIRMLQAVTEAADETTESLIKLKKQAMEDGPRMGIDPIEVAKTQTELGKAGFKRDEIHQMTPAVLRMARSSDSDPQQSGEILGSTMRQFGLEANQAGRVADVLAMTVNRSAISLTELGDSMKYIGPLAKGLGMSLEETAALIGVLGNLGIKGEQAGTALRAIEIRAAAMGEKFAKAGIQTRDAAGDLLHPVQILQNMLRVMEKMGTGDRADLFADLFGMRGMLGAVPINDKALVDIEAFERALMEAAGSAAKNAAILDGGVGGAMRRIGAEFTTLKIKVQEALAPMFLGFLTDAKRFVAWMETVITKNPELVKQLTLAAFGVTALGIALGAVALALTILTTPAGAITAALALLGLASVSASMDFGDSMNAILERIERGDIVGAWEEMIEQMRLALGLFLDDLTGLADFNRFFGIGPQGDPEGWAKLQKWKREDRARRRDEQLGIGPGMKAPGLLLPKVDLGPSSDTAEIGGQAVAIGGVIAGAIKEGFAMAVPQQAQATRDVMGGLIEAVESRTPEAARRAAENAQAKQMSELTAINKATAASTKDAAETLHDITKKLEDLEKKLAVE